MPITRRGVRQVLLNAVEALRSGQHSDRMSHMHADMCGVHLPCLFDVSIWRQNNNLFRCELSFFEEPEAECVDDAARAAVRLFYGESESQLEVYCVFDDVTDNTVASVYKMLKQAENVRRCSACDELFSSAERSLCPRCTLCLPEIAAEDETPETCVVCHDPVVPHAACTQCRCALHGACYDRMAAEWKGECPQCRRPMKRQRV